MVTFDWHIIKRVTGSYVLLVAGLILFFILLHYLEHIDDFLDSKAPLTRIYTVYYPSYIPEIVRLISPLALFLAAIYVTGKLAQRLEIIALQTGGVALYRLLIPYSLVGLAASALMLTVGGWLAPRTNQTVLDYDSLYLKDAPKQVDISDIHLQNDPLSVITVGYFNRRTSTAHRVLLQRFSTDGQLTERIDAQTMVWRDSVWHIPYGTVRAFDGDRETRRVAVSIDTILQVFPRDLARTERDIETMTIPVAADYVDALRRSGTADIGHAEVGYYTKYTYPLANLIVMLIALPLACTRRRGGQAVQIGLGLLVAFSYLAVQKLTEPFGYSGELDPMLTAALPHAVFLIGALMALRWSRA
ncbi:MAG: LptF/LptG family permease [Bacteroidota bacterium]|nr:LptF/LptG family permease [Bacteroidota bacterium]